MLTRFLKDTARANVQRLKRPKTIARYAAPRSLLKPEIAILSSLKTEFSEKRILDLGVGGGQTTAALLEISKKYVGTDISPDMVSLCRARFPMTCFDVCDARDLSSFPCESFDLVIFCGAGIDAVGHEDRKIVLKEVYRVLSNNGAFVFSSHNLRSSLRRPWHSSKLPWRINCFQYPKRFVTQTARFLTSTFNHCRNKAYEERHDEYAILNDEADHFGFVLYYITVEEQIKQLDSCGFCLVRPFDLNGDLLSSEGSLNCRDTWVHYLCRKRQ
jgi:ubiquinone/menaquinone biosynthesis C-methylase UbiE